MLEEARNGNSNEMNSKAFSPSPIPRANVTHMDEEEKNHIIEL